MPGRAWGCKHHEARGPHLGLPLERLPHHVVGSAAGRHRWGRPGQGRVGSFGVAGVKAPIVKQHRMEGAAVPLRDCRPTPLVPACTMRAQYRQLQARCAVRHMCAPHGLALGYRHLQVCDGQQHGRQHAAPPRVLVKAVLWMGLLGMMGGRGSAGEGQGLAARRQHAATPLSSKAAACVLAQSAHLPAAAHTCRKAAQANSSPQADAPRPPSRQRR